MGETAEKREDLRLIDAIEPFFRNYDKRRINWSKIPFHHLQTEGAGRDAQWREIAADMGRFTARAKAEGFTAVTLVRRFPGGATPPAGRPRQASLPAVGTALRAVQLGQASSDRACCSS